MSLTAIVPVKDRAEIELSARSLLAACPELTTLLICDGGSTEPTCCRALQALAQLPRVRLLCQPQSGFNKATLLNGGLQAAASEWVLCSDADILWSAAAVAALWHAARSPQTLATIANVRETAPTTAALQRARYTYHLRQERGVQIVAIVAESAATATAPAARPGCGLVCARRSTLLALGGYQQCFTGWGWEDRDLLLRAQLCGLNWATAGAVLHCSHPDTWRNRMDSDPPAVTRDRNIARSLRAIARGEVWGDLRPLATAPAQLVLPVRVEWRPEFAALAP